MACTKGYFECGCRDGGGWSGKAPEPEKQPRDDKKKPAPARYAADSRGDGRWK